MTKYGRRAAGTPLTDEQMAELKAVAELPDSEIDFSDIPERVQGLLLRLSQRLSLQTCSYK